MFADASRMAQEPHDGGSSCINSRTGSPAVSDRRQRRRVRFARAAAAGRTARPLVRALRRRRLRPATAPSASSTVNCPARRTRVCRAQRRAVTVAQHREAPRQNAPVAEARQQLRQAGRRLRPWRTPRRPARRAAPRSCSTPAVGGRSGLLRDAAGPRRLSVSVPPPLHSASCAGRRRAGAHAGEPVGHGDQALPVAREVRLRRLRAEPVRQAREAEARPVRQRSNAQPGSCAPARSSRWRGTRQKLRSRRQQANHVAQVRLRSFESTEGRRCPADPRSWTSVLNRSASTGKRHFGRARRRRGAQVGHVVDQRPVGLVAHGRDERDQALGHGANHGFVVVAPQVFERAAAAGHDDQMRAVRAYAVEQRVEAADRRRHLGARCPRPARARARRAHGAGSGPRRGAGCRGSRRRSAR